MSDQPPSAESKSEKPPVIALKEVSKWFPAPHHGERLVTVDKISFEIPDVGEGEFIVLLGPSGCGKSTILNMIAGMLTPDSGEVCTYGKSVIGPNPLAVTVPQAYTCFPWLTVLGNVEFGLNILGKPPQERQRVAVEYLTKVGLSDRCSASPRHLSGGMQQRVAIARTLAMRLPIVLMDEPFGALDAQTRSDMQQMLLQLWQEEKNTILFVTHDITEGLLLADRILVFSARPAQIVHDLKVPFARPRLPSLIYEEAFVHLSQALLQLLKQAPTSGQVRVTV
jgi:NitT/TauT family transport system ATP-binding protein